ncbi:MAG: hypothetical protein V4760_13450 [Bdellovibrionota bacterium]
MREHFGIRANVVFLFTCLIASVGCSHAEKRHDLPTVKLSAPIELRLKAEMGRTESVDYLHKSTSDSFEDRDVRRRTEDMLAFTSQAETIKVEPQGGAGGIGTFTQVITTSKKIGNSDLHDFAMPEPGEKHEVTADSRGRILKSGEYPPNSLFYVPPVSLPEGPVAIGDTWAMQAAWLSLDNMIPYQLDMVSILKGVYECGDDQCADVELSGEVGFQGSLNVAMSFRSTWKGRMLFALKTGTVAWSRVDSEERFIADNTRRDVNSCLESVLKAPTSVKLPAGYDSPKCDPKPAVDTQVATD